MKAILRTLCGCERQIDIPYPPTKSFIVALAQNANFTEPSPTVERLMGLPVREFVLDSFGNAGPVDSVAVYVERNTHIR